jgi:hypothetical protein
MDGGNYTMAHRELFTEAGKAQQESMSVSTLVIFGSPWPGR